LRHNGFFNIAFVDGHSKAVKFIAGWAAAGENNRFAMPADPSLILDYCADPNEEIEPNDPTTVDQIPFGDNDTQPVQCSALPNLMVQTYGRPCTAADGPGSNCTWTN
jgi:prepilin-type processing-associated H-X9-DG protein